MVEKLTSPDTDKYSWKGEIYVSKSGNKSPKWFTDIFFSGVSAEERRKLRSKTFPGIADAMANQWGGKMAA